MKILRKTADKPVSIACVLAKIRSRIIPIKSQKYYRLSKCSRWSGTYYDLQDFFKQSNN
jgi:hypothetical protein